VHRQRAVELGMEFRGNLIRIMLSRLLHHVVQLSHTTFPPLTYQFVTLQRLRVSTTTSTLFYRHRHATTPMCRPDTCVIV
jgi:hypothetical protein